MIIAHRINSINELKEIKSEYGIEIDVRYDTTDKCLILSHDIEFKNPCKLSEFIRCANHEMIIFNIKSSQCEELVISLMEKNNIENYYFLDSQIPDIVRLAKKGYGPKFITRISQYETLNKSLFDLCSNYVWVDTFGELEFYFIEKQSNKDYIFVSPELHKKNENIKKFKKVLDEDFFGYSICTDYTSDWI